jgi:thioredoxin-related protein
MSRKIALPLGVAGLLLFVALGLMLNDYKKPAVSSNRTEWKHFDEGIALAKQQRKKVVVDVYTDWCTWCKKMDEETYANRTVIEALEEHFILIKLNAESSDPLTFNGETMTQAEFAQAAGVTGYPATLFLDEQQKPITVVPGYSPPDKFAQILRYFGQNHYKTTQFQDYLSQRGG